MTDLEIYANAPEDATQAEMEDYLEEACGGDDALRSRVEKLLASEKGSDDFHEEATVKYARPETTVIYLRPKKPEPGESPPMAGSKRPRKSSSPFDVPSAEEVNEALPGFEINEFLGSGGMGAVFKAHQKQLNRTVAIKVLPPALGEKARYAERFKREARAMAQLSHPNIVTVFDFGIVSSGMQFIVMECVEGENLSRVIARREITTQHCLHWIQQVCDALAYAHARGIIHRDIKPANILIDRNDNVKVADFGLAKLVDPLLMQSDLTLPGTVLGTPDYMPPEALESTATPDHRADIYAIGVLLYQILTGILPRGSWEMPSKLAEVDERFDRIINRALKPTPAERYQDASDISSELGAIEKTTAWQTGAGKRRVRFKFPESRVAVISRPSPEKIVRSALPVATVVKPSTAVDPETKKKRWMIAGTVFGVIVLIAAGLFFFASAREKAAVKKLETLATQESPQGSAKEVALALKYLSSRDSPRDVKANAIATLKKLDGNGVDEAIMAALQASSSPYTRGRLSEVLADRNYAKAVPAMWMAFARTPAGSSRRPVILNSIRRIAGPENAKVLLDALATTQGMTDRIQLESILLAIYRKQPDNDDVIEELLTRISNANDEERLSLFRILGTLGGDRALIRLRAVLNHDDSEGRMKRTAAMAAYLSWPDRSALQPLEKLIAEGAGGDALVRNKAIEAYARISSLPAPTTTEEKIAAWRKALGWSRGIRNYQRIFVGTVLNPSEETLAFAKEYVNDASQSLSSHALKAAAEIERLTMEAPVLASGGRLEAEAAIRRGDPRSALGRPLTDDNGVPVTPLDFVISNWTSPDTWFAWHFKVEEAGNFGLEVIQSDQNADPSGFQVIIGDKAFDGKSKNTDSWRDFVPVTLDGTVALEPGKVYSLFLTAHGVIQPQMMNIEALRVVKK